MPIDPKLTQKIRNYFLFRPKRHIREWLFELIEVFYRILRKIKLYKIKLFLILAPQRKVI